MAVRPILLYAKDEPVLRRKCRPLADRAPDAKQLLADLKDTLLHDGRGIGLAAPQIGVKTRTQWTCTLAMLATLLISSEASAQGGRGWGRGAGPGNGWGRGGGGYGRGWGAAGPAAPDCLFGPRMAYWLDLTRAQQDAIEELRLKAMDVERPLWRELERAEFERSSLLNAPNYDQKAAETLSKKAGDLEAEIDDVWSKYREQVLALLTPQQRQSYDRMMASRPYGGPDYGAGYGRGRGRHPCWEGGAGPWTGPGWGWRGPGWGWRRGVWGCPSQ